MSYSVFILLVTASMLVSARPLKIRGYVTDVHSDTSFDIDDYRIQRDETLVLEFEKADSTSDDLPSDIRVGTLLEIKGDFDAGSGVLKATSVKVFPTELRKLKRTALVEETPVLKRVGDSWVGELRVDGQILEIDQSTVVAVVPNSTQKKASMRSAPRQNATNTRSSDNEVDEPREESVQVKATTELHSNMFADYVGKRLDDGRVQVSRISFRDNEFTKEEARLWKSLTPKIKELSPSAPGVVRVGLQRFKIFPDSELQQYVRALGSSLIPPIQRESHGGLGFIPFQFYVVDDPTVNAGAFANGLVLVHSGLFEVLEDEAQLAFILGHEIAHATQKHTLRQLEFHRKEKIALQVGAAVAAAYGAYGVRDSVNLVYAAIQNGYQRYLENQADRIGMEYMTRAGFDAREAPRAWKAISLKQGDRATNFFWSNHDSRTIRRSYLMTELRMNYQHVDFASGRQDSERFQRFRASILQKRSGKKRITVKL